MLQNDCGALQGRRHIIIARFERREREGIKKEALDALRPVREDALARSPVCHGSRIEAIARTAPSSPFEIRFDSAALRLSGFALSLSERGGSENVHLPLGMNPGMPVSTTELKCLTRVLIP
jgi:hypothetical protein